MCSSYEILKNINNGPNKNLREFRQFMGHKKISKIVYWTTLAILILLTLLNLLYYLPSFAGFFGLSDFTNWLLILYIIPWSGLALGLLVSGISLASVRNINISWRRPALLLIAIYLITFVLAVYSRPGCSIFAPFCW